MATMAQHLSSSRSILCRSVQNNLYISKRFRVKKKWAATRKTQTASQVAMEYFDNYYAPVYGKRWPSLRIALLSQNKYCALANNFCQLDDITENFEPGVFDFIQTARSTLSSLGENKNLSDLSKIDQSGITPKVDEQSVRSSDYYVTAEGDKMEFDPTDIYQYMPVKQVKSEEDELLEQERSQSLYQPTEMDVSIVEDQPVNIPQKLRAFCYDQGEVSLFPPPSSDNAHALGYYLMDAASLLPVMALGLTPGDHVLDLCAAPGGKTLAMAQTLLPEKIVSVDHSYSRIGRLRDTMRWYLPRSYIKDRRIETIHGNAVTYCQQETRRFDKILVDVPCYTDRHVVLEDDNNIFRRTRMKDRLQIQALQHKLLLGALTLLRPGGTLVYSTCTLSMPQNDGTVQTVLDKLWQLSNIDVSVVNTAPLVDRFRDTFYFHDKCRLGQMVLPNLMANFGPSYFSKIIRNR